MRIISEEIGRQIHNSSWIRRMFEAGNELKRYHGADKVYDFSLGNPDLPPPASAKEILVELAQKLDQPRMLGYVSNSGIAELREALAAMLAKEQASPRLTAEQIIVSCGAAGAITSFFRAVLDAGDEVICPSPYFVEYGFYCGHFGGTLKPVPSSEPNFDLDVDAIMAAVTPATRVILLNSPNNPTGCIYPVATLRKLADKLALVNAGRERPIFLLSDEPYRFLAYDDVEVPPILPLSPFSVVIGSFSKQLSLAGERIGYLAISPDMPGRAELMQAVTMTTRTLGFVNAPIIGQYLALKLLDQGVDLSVYTERRAIMAKVLSNAGIEFTMPQGAFYFFPKAPGGDDVAFAECLLKENVLAVPGRGFGCAGYFRLSFSVETSVIERSQRGFERAVKLCGI